MKLKRKNQPNNQLQKTYPGRFVCDKSWTSFSFYFWRSWPFAIV